MQHDNRLRIVDEKMKSDVVYCDAVLVTFNGNHEVIYYEYSTVIIKHYSFYLIQFCCSRIGARLFIPFTRKLNHVEIHFKSSSAFSKTF